MSTPTLQQLRYLVAIADNGGFVAAAERLFVSQPALSSQIKELEKRLGVTLLERAPRGALLTPIGKQVVERSRLVIREVEDIVGLVDTDTHGLQGRVDIAAIPTVAPYLFMNVVRVLTNKYPKLKLHLHEERTTDLVAKLALGDIDFGILATPVPNADEFVVVPLGDDPFLLAFAKGHHLAKTKSSATLSALTDQKVLLLEEGHCLRDQAVEVCRRGNFQTEDIQATSLPTLMQMVAAGLGVTLLPRCAASVEARRGSGIVLKEFATSGPKRTLALVWRKTSPYQEQFYAVSQLLKNELASVLEQGS